MTTSSETGYARNLGHFEQLLTFCRSLGAAYNPSSPGLSVRNMEATLAHSRTALSDTDEQKNRLDQAINQRAREFKELRPLATRVFNAFAICGADSLAIDDVKGHNRKIQGGRASVAKKPATAKDAPAAAASHRTISASQTSFDFQLEHLIKLIQAVAQEPSYQPNETALTPGGLRSKLEAMQTSNTAFMTAYAQWSNARLRRDYVFNEPLLGLVEVAAGAKKYLKAAFGATSPQYKQVAGLNFKKVTT